MRRRENGARNSYALNSGDATYDPLYPFGHGLTY